MSESKNAFVYSDDVTKDKKTGKLNIGSNITDKEARSFLCLMEDGFNEKVERDEKNELIKLLFQEGFECRSPKGDKKIGSKLIQQCMWRVMSKVKFLDFQIHSSRRSEEIERITTDGFRTIVDRGGLDTAFRDKGGVFFNSFLYGDGFVQMGKGGNAKAPIEFRVLENNSVYADNFANGIRGTRPAQKLGVVYSFDKEEAWNIWPELEENRVFGRLPGSYELERSSDFRQYQDVLEVGWFYNLTTETQTQIAGSQLFKLDQFSGKEYPWRKNGEAFIPVYQFMCQPAVDQFYNYGIGDMIYDLAVISRRLFNLQIGHVEDNVYPLTLINAPQAKVNELTQKMAMAYKARGNGKKPIVAMEFDPSGGNSGVQAQSLITQSLFNEWQIIWDQLSREVARLGVFIDDVDRGGGVTRGQVIAEEEASNAFVKQSMEYNATETQELVEDVLITMMDQVSPRNKTLINMTARVTLPSGEEVKMEEPITYGSVAKEIKEGEYFVTVNSRTGSIPSDLVRITQLENMMQYMAPGSPEQQAIVKKLFYLRDLDYPQGQNAPVPPPEQGGPGPGGGTDVNAAAAAGLPAGAPTDTGRATLTSEKPGMAIPL